MLEIFWRFLILGLTSFGGPAAHIGYFRQTFVEKLHWLDSEHYHRLIALSQFLPGPGSSQIGFAIGLQRGGLAGGITAFIAFTLPSFFLLYALAIGLQTSEVLKLDGLIHGLKLLALVVILDAIWSMWRSFCHQTLTRIIASTTAIVLLLIPSFFIQVALLLLMSLVGVVFLRQSPPQQTQTDDEKFSLSGKLWLALTLLLFALSLFDWQHAALELFAEFYQAGSLVFGGGHVVLPLLQQTLGERLSTDSFLTAYAAAQAVPGPMFTLSAYLGADSLPSSPLSGALIATLAIFLPGFLLVLALHDHWQNLAQKPRFAGAVIAINASVVGFLIATLIQPVAPSALMHWPDIIAALLGIYLLIFRRLSVFWLILLFSAYGVLGGLI
ncbi:chromate efflux transporter [Thiomicrorhabdus heinhorstiae]|uniref:Chromate efflux transporter n=1 Tax=Thiomicrorhabdus heinhorstiae TaxID=2748010 RepID=A0ABS0C3N6_9GAMM|nr:chromate efflux transporter [Thiomicrorhabdus heinhorstiae]MBF6058877.1 chromate efflux transporter [Thiomicrorhabdus heinhorstiae]